MEVWKPVWISHLLHTADSCRAALSKYWHLWHHVSHPSTANIPPNHQTHKIFYFRVLHKSGALPEMSCVCTKVKNRSFLTAVQVVFTPFLPAPLLCLSPNWLTFSVSVNSGIFLTAASALVHRMHNVPSACEQEEEKWFLTDELNQRFISAKLFPSPNKWVKFPKGQHRGDSKAVSYVTNQLQYHNKGEKKSQMNE